jgi:hypothetical protein
MEREWWKREDEGEGAVYLWQSGQEIETMETEPRYVVEEIIGRFASAIEMLDGWLNAYDVDKKIGGQYMNFARVFEGLIDNARRRSRELFDAIEPFLKDVQVVRTMETGVHRVLEAVKEG